MPSPPVHDDGPSPTRRRLLSTVGTSVGLAGLAGCLGGDEDVPDPAPLAVSPTDWTHRDGGPGHSWSTAGTALPASLGTEAWSVEFPGADGIEAPVVHGGRAFVRVHGPWVSGEVPSGPRRAVLAAFDVATGEVLWTFESPSSDARESVSDVAVAGESVFLTTTLGDGFDLGGGRCYALDAATGAPRWSRSTWVARRLTVDPAGRVYLTEWSDSLVRSGRDGGLAARNRSERVRLRAFDAATGADLWTYPRPNPLDGLVLAPGYRASELMYHPPSLAEDDLLWALSPVRDDDSFDTDADPELHRLEPGTGKRRSVRRLPDTVDGPVAVGDDAWYSMSRDWPDADTSVAFRVDHGGKRRWGVSVPHWTGTVAVADEAGVVCAQGRALRAVDAERGEQLWRDEVVTGKPTVAGDNVAYVTVAPDGNDDGPGPKKLLVRDARSGAVEADRPLPPASNQAIPAAGRVFVTTFEYDGSPPTLHVYG